MIFKISEDSLGHAIERFVHLINHLVLFFHIKRTVLTIPSYKHDTLLRSYDVSNICSNESSATLDL